MKNNKRKAKNNKRKADDFDTLDLLKDIKREMGGLARKNIKDKQLENILEEIEVVFEKAKRYGKKLKKNDQKIEFYCMMDYEIMVLNEIADEIDETIDKSKIYK